MKLVNDMPGIKKRNKIRVNASFIMLKKAQTYFKNLAWPFFNIMEERVKNKTKSQRRLQ